MIEIYRERFRWQKPTGGARVLRRNREYGKVGKWEEGVEGDGTGMGWNIRGNSRDLGRWVGDNVGICQPPFSRRWKQPPPRDSGKGERNGVVLYHEILLVLFSLGGTSYPGKSGACYGYRKGNNVSRRGGEGRETAFICSPIVRVSLSAGGTQYRRRFNISCDSRNKMSVE